MSDANFHQLLHPSHWKAAVGYANGVLASGQSVFVGGQIGWNADQVFESDDFVVQVNQALQNIVAILKEANAGPEHIVRLTWYVTDKQEYLARLKEVGTAYREVLGKHFPAMTMVQVAGLVEDQAKVEIEATAVIPAV
ncbi:RidA family protein [Vreelandella titanicae]|jgi:enamine deaminase RidA (YjgF/YER057c/UK114 family)|uniref:RidA family protein n=1 Tax=Halomonadaceae TaxID=28256 RepID=UPI000344F758|nr:MULTISPECIES: RidA family protein [Halomonas]MCE7520832.1 RidA family protein [Halomonas titanicae]NVE92042.1 RidA family protein [Halomonas titanicae]PKH62220.1 RidA family protein [Halomonas sp. Choline-3u-9]QGQ69988.1 RidA family protein [Halomonas sp. PA16-9]|tara:strand:+ start:304 stop:717 length:414 start_codon:yes stop_codon:yes gene_type:complete